MIVVLVCWGFVFVVALFGIAAKAFQYRAARRAAEAEQARRDAQERQRAEAMRQAREKQAAAQAEKERAEQARKQEQERKRAEKAAARAEREQAQERKRAERLEAARQLAEYKERALQAEKELRILQQEERRKTVSSPAPVSLEQFAAAQAEEKPQAPRTFAGESVAFTGKLQAMTRAEAIALVRERGGKAFETMPAGATLLVVGKNPGAGKMDKADEWITQVTKITEAQFLERVRAAA